MINKADKHKKAIADHLDQLCKLHGVDNYLTKPEPKRTQSIQIRKLKREAGLE